MPDHMDYIDELGRKSVQAMEEASFLRGQRMLGRVMHGISAADASLHAINVLASSVAGDPIAAGAAYVVNHADFPTVSTLTAKIRDSFGAKIGVQSFGNTKPAITTNSLPVAAMLYGLDPAGTGSQQATIGAGGQLWVSGSGLSAKSLVADDAGNRIGSDTFGALSIGTGTRGLAAVALAYARTSGATIESLRITDAGYLRAVLMEGVTVSGSALSALIAPRGGRTFAVSGASLTAKTTQGTSPWVIAGTVDANCTQVTSPWRVDNAAGSVLAVSGASLSAEVLIEGLSGAARVPGTVQDHSEDPGLDTSHVGQHTVSLTRWRHYVSDNLPTSGVIQVYTSAAKSAATDWIDVRAYDAGRLYYALRGSGAFDHLSIALRMRPYQVSADAFVVSDGWLSRFEHEDTEIDTQSQGKEIFKSVSLPMDDAEEIQFQVSGFGLTNSTSKIFEVTKFHLGLKKT